MVDILKAAPTVRTAYPPPLNNTAGTRILIMGDSWGTVSPATEHFEKELNEHKVRVRPKREHPLPRTHE